MELKAFMVGFFIGIVTGLLLCRNRTRNSGVPKYENPPPPPAKPFFTFDTTIDPLVKSYGDYWLSQIQEGGERPSTSSSLKNWPK